MIAGVAREGTVAVPGGRVWYHIAGDGSGVPLLTMHGGPGMTHDSHETLADLGAERPVVFYDQLGSGKSERPEGPSLWRIERFVEELGAIRAALGLERVHLFGHSWGTMLAVDYLLTKPEGVVSVTLAGPCLSVARFAEDCLRLRAALPAAVRDILDAHESAGTTASAEYQRAAMEFHRQHMCRTWPWPDSMTRTLAGANMGIYRAMWGSNDFVADGNLKGYDRTARLNELVLPVLLTTGRYDGCTPEAAAQDAAAIPGAEMAIFEQSAHMPHLEERDAYMDVLRAFLRRAESA